MKQRITIFTIALSTILLTALTFVDRQHKAEVACAAAPVDFDYDVGSRYFATISKADLYKAESVVDIVPKDADWGSFRIKTVKVKMEGTGCMVAEIGEGPSLNEAQKKLLQKTDYADDISLLATCKGPHTMTGCGGKDHVIEHDQFEIGYFVSIVPEQEATFEGGMEAVTAYVKKYSRQAIEIAEQDGLKSGKVTFVINTEGAISDVELESSSGYSIIDETIVDLITNLPGEWVPAQDANGQTVEQELVFSFGQIGC